MSPEPNGDRAGRARVPRHRRPRRGGPESHRQPAQEFRRRAGGPMLVLAALAAGVVGLGAVGTVGTTDLGRLVADVGTPGPSTPAAATPDSASSGPTSVAPSPGVPSATAPPATAGPRWVKPAPLVQPFARSLTKSARKPGQKRLTTPVPKGVDGCDHSYGNAQQCIPHTFPRGVTDRCGWLAEHGLKSFRSRAGDRLALDPSKDGVACGTND